VADVGVDERPPLASIARTPARPAA
jgi:hypothetical protein